MLFPLHDFDNATATLQAQHVRFTNFLFTHFLEVLKYLSSLRRHVQLFPDLHLVLHLSVTH